MHDQIHGSDPKPKSDPCPESDPRLEALPRLEAMPRPESMPRPDQGTRKSESSRKPSPRLLAICAGKVNPYHHLKSAMIKSVLGSIESPTQVALGRLGLLGDEQAEVGLHGGIDQAIYMYPVEHWAFWQQQRALLGINEAMAFGFVGENLSIEGLLEDDVSAGDRLSIGDVLLQVTGPRIPCIKFNWRMGYAKASKHMIQSGRCGWYCSVLQTGVLVPGASIHLLPGRKLLNIADQLRLQQKHIDRQLELFK